MKDLGQNGPTGQNAARSVVGACKKRRVYVWEGTTAKDPASRPAPAILSGVGASGAVSLIGRGALLRAVLECRPGQGNAELLECWTRLEVTVRELRLSRSPVKCLVALVSSYIHFPLQSQSHIGREYQSKKRLTDIMSQYITYVNNKSITSVVEVVVVDKNRLNLIHTLVYRFLKNNFLKSVPTLKNA